MSGLYELGRINQSNLGNFESYWKKTINKYKNTNQGIDKTVDILKKIFFAIDKKFKRYKWGKYKAMCDRTQTVLKK